MDEGVLLGDPVAAVSLVENIQNTLLSKGESDDLDDKLLDQLDDSVDEIFTINQSVMEITRKLKVAKESYASSYEAYKKFCANIVESVKAEGRATLTQEEKAQLQMHAEKFQQAKESVASLNVEMRENLNKMKAISERYKDDVKELKVDDVVDSWRERGRVEAEDPVSPNRTMSFSGGHRAPTQPFLAEARAAPPSVAPPTTAPSRPKTQGGGKGV